MATGTAGSSARQYSTQQVHYLRKAVAYNTSNIGTADSVLIGTLPNGAQIVDAVVNVTTAFNAGTTNVLTAGTSSGSNADVISASDVTEGSTGANRATTGIALSFSADTPIYAKYTQSGTAATTGAAVICIMYVANNDG